jgi:hypothetical protein
MMILKLKTLGLAGFAALALSAFLVSTASASEFTASKYPTSITAASIKGNDVFKIEGGSVECNSHFSGTLTKASSSITATAHYFECQAFGFLNATVIMGCDYVFHADGAVDVECPATNKIVITAGTCEVQIGTQTGLKKVELSNGSGDVNAKANVTGIKYTVTVDGFGCPLNGTGEKTGGTYTQSSSVTVSSTNGASVSVDVPPSVSFTMSSYPTTVTGESASGNDTFTTEAGTMECKTHYESSLSAASSQLTVKTTMSECRSFGFLSATVAMGSCDYLYKTPAGSGDNWSSAAEIKCTNSAEPIRIVAGNCEVTTGEQSPSGSVSITNNTAAGDVSIKAGLSGINYTVLKDGFGCPFGGTGAKTGATYTQHNAVTFDSTNGATIDVG